MDLVEQVLGPLDGSGHQLGEEGDEEGVAEEIPLGLHLAPVHVHGIAQGLEGIEGDAHGQDHIKDRLVQGDPAQGEEGLQIVPEKAPVFEEKEDGQVGEKAQGHPQPTQPPALFPVGHLPRPLEQQPAHKGDARWTGP